MIIMACRTQNSPSQHDSPEPIVHVSDSLESVASGTAVSYGRSEGYKQKTTYWAAPIEHVLSTPEWFSFPNKPPLSLERAISIAKRWQAERGVYATVVTQVCLYQKPPASNRWAYRISFDPNTDTRMTRGNESSTIVVLLDGSVVVETVETPKK